VAALKARHNVQGFPTLVVTRPDGSSDGTSSTRSLGYRSRWSVIRFLERTVKPGGPGAKPKA
jgi:hypothetical protein